MKIASILQNSIRGTGAIVLILGLVIWSGSADFLVSLHVLLGILLVLALFALAYLAVRAGISLGLVSLAGAWALVLPLLGLVQENILMGVNHWVVPVLHLFLGVGAVGMAEILAGRIKKAAARSVHV